MPEQPEKTIPLLLKARPLIAAHQGSRGPRLKLEELDEAIALCAGLYLDASTDRYAVVPGETLQVNFEATNRSRFPLALKSVKLEGMDGAPSQDFPPVALAYNQPDRALADGLRSRRTSPYSQPYWLRKPGNGFTYVIEDQELVGLAETPPVLRARIRIQAGAEEIEFIRPVVRRYVDRRRRARRPGRWWWCRPWRSASPNRSLLFPDAQAEDRRSAAPRQRRPARPASCALEAAAGLARPAGLGAVPARGSRRGDRRWPSPSRRRPAPPRGQLRGRRQGRPAARSPPACA